MAKVIKRIELTEDDARRDFTSTDTEGKTYRNRLTYIDLLDDGSVWCWAANMTLKGQPYKNGMGLTMGPARDYGQDVADVVAEAIAKNDATNTTEASAEVKAWTTMRALGVTRDHLRDARNVWNGARKIAVMRLRQADEIEAYRLNRKFDKLVALDATIVPQIPVSRGSWTALIRAGLSSDQKAIRVTMPAYPFDPEKHPERSVDIDPTETRWLIKMLQAMVEAVESPCNPGPNGHCRAHAHQVTEPATA